MENIYKFSTVKAKEKDDRILRFIGSDSKTDRDGDQVKSDGWKLTEYRKNPVVLLGHSYGGTPVAKTKKVWIDNDKNQLMFDIEFPESDVSSIGDSLYKLYKAGYMSATSVGFVPNHDKIEYPKRKQGKANQPWRVFNEQTLLEISLVAVPANPRALLTSKSIRKAIDDSVIDEIELNELLDYFLDENKKVDEDKEGTLPIEKDEDGNLKVTINAMDAESLVEEINKSEISNNLVEQISKLKDDIDLLKDIVSAKNTDKISYIDKLFDDSYDEFVESRDSKTDSKSETEQINDLCNEILTEVNKDGNK